jgi:hypothetical protein
MITLQKCGIGETFLILSQIHALFETEIHTFVYLYQIIVYIGLLQFIFYHEFLLLGV